VIRDSWSSSQDRCEIATPEPLPAGKHTILFEFQYDGGGIENVAAAS
jgi:hypothetical protein